MNEPFRARFAAAGLCVMTRSFPGDHGQPLHYGCWREPGEEPEPGWRKGREFFVDLESGDWSRFGGPWRPFREFALSGDHEKSTPPADHSAAAIVSTSLQEDGQSAASEAGCGSDNSPDRQAGHSARNSEVLSGLPTEVRPWFERCVAAGFELELDGLKHCIGGWDTGNRFGTYRGQYELLCGRTGRIITGPARRFQKFTLEEYLAHDSQAAAPTARAVIARPFQVEHPTGPRASEQRSLFA
ncbi:hypothetical protein Pan44_26500 [Caulifigura coniformis]|uniref:Uncharacterized protein n=1 Tax=Caulifigura coniformis TaxID=2527983 RepID=A0A517SER0_9PLAN|nr:hypothetical protein [Caulifigura coniformis]QDT54615.1 hypothetical protein Pan44_26500 [Caulifigura coniformis]